jgi:RNA polymerase sigma-70 factor (ECF subfamily)
MEEGEIPFTGNEADKSVWVKEQCDSCLAAFCHCLNNESRLIFVFKKIANLSHADIGTIMESSEENIRQTASRSK